MNKSMFQLGWSEFFKRPFEVYQQRGFVPARVARENRGAYLVYWEQGESTAEVTGKFLHEAVSVSNFPAVGDWVAISSPTQTQPARIHALLPRRSCFSRKAVGGNTEEQVAAANVDTVFLVSGLDHNFNPRRIERYLTVAYDSGAVPVIVLNKVDLVHDVDAVVLETESIACGVRVLAVSAVSMQGLKNLQPYLAAGTTTAFLGSSGVGKSSLINSLLGDDRLAVSAVRKGDSHGRHTTTHREMILLPQGGLVIDTPGMRELQLWAAEDSLDGSFHEVEELALRCRFSDCRHRGEPGCAVQAAVERGELSAARLENYRKMQRELRFLARKQAHKTRLRDWEKKKILQQKYNSRRKKDF